MRRATSHLLKVLLLIVGGVVASAAVSAGPGAASDAAKRPNNSFNLYVSVPPGASNVASQSQGVGVAASKGVIMDPYKVPLIQNAGSLTPGR